MPESASQVRRVRLADPGDVAALVRLRAIMFEAMGASGVQDEDWQRAATGWFHDHLDDDHQRIVVVESGGQVVACAVGSLRSRIPSPRSPGDFQMLVSNVATDPEHRRRGYARAAVAELMRWAREESPAGGAELVATGEGAGLYRDAGFTEHPFPLMRVSWG